MTPMSQTGSIRYSDNIDHQPPQGENAPPAPGRRRPRPELTRVLRWSGGIVLGSAAVTFMCQGVYSLAPMTRHWMMLAVCGLLGLLGVATGTLLKEDKGARAFLGFAALAFPVLASQMGAMFFSLFGQPPLGMPQPLVFSLVTSSKVLMTTAASLAIVVPASLLAFRILARSQAGVLTGVFTVANLMLLLPVREGLWLYAMLAVMAAGLYWVDNTRLRKDFRLDCFEGRVSRLMLAAPLGVMAGRAMFYPVGSAFYSLLLGVASAYLSFHLGRVVKKSGIRKLCRSAGLTGLAVSWLILLVPILDSAVLAAWQAAYLVLLPMAALLGIQSLTADDKDGSGYRGAAAITALLGIMVAHCLSPVSMASVVGILVAVAVVAAGTLAGEKPVFISGLLAAAISLGNIGWQTVKVHNGYTWVALALIGMGVILSASLIEKGRTRQMLAGSGLWGRLRS